MNERLEKVVRRVIYWKNAYDDSREKFHDTSDERYLARMDANLLQLLAATRGLKRVYERETGKEVITIGNLPDFRLMNKRMF